jgi:hypothetical protein
LLFAQLSSGIASWRRASVARPQRLQPPVGKPSVEPLRLEFPDPAHQPSVRGGRSGGLLAPFFVALPVRFTAEVGMSVPRSPGGLAELEHAGAVVTARE